MTVGTLEAHGKLRRQDRPWSAAVRRPSTTWVRDLASLAQRPGAEGLAPMPFASSDGPLVGATLDVAGTIARERAAAVAAARAAR